MEEGNQGESLSKIQIIGQVLLFSLLVFSSSGYSAVLVEEGAEQNEIERNKNRLIFLPIIYYTPETRIAVGLGGMYYFRTSRKKQESRPWILASAGSPQAYTLL